MKRKMNQYIAQVLTIILVVFVISSCEESVISPNGGGNGNDKTEISDIYGSWLQMPLEGEQSKERTLDFSDGFGTLIYPDRTGDCDGKPELLKRFSWEEVAEGARILKLNVFRHEECGIAKEQAYEELAYYSNSGTTLRIFSYSWIRQREHNDVLIKY